MKLEKILDLMKHTPWNFYPVCDRNFTHLEEYAERREKLDAIGSVISSTGIGAWWTGIDTYDFTNVDRVMEALLKGHPNRWFVPRISLTPPRDWMKAHPAELCVYWGGPQTEEEIRDLIDTPLHDWAGWDEDIRPYPKQLIANQSFSSQVWVKDACEALKHLVRHMEESPWGSQIAGYMPANGNCGENMWWGDWRNQGDPRKGDFGISHKKHFFAWALQKYGSLEALREAWHMPDLTEDHLPMPTPMERWSEGGKNLRQVLLADDQRQVDCNEFHSKACFDALEAFGRTIKENSGKAAGGFYGYLQDETVGYGGHLAIDRALNTPWLDFYSSPKAYHYCLAGEPGASQAPGQSFARKKLWVEENDCRSHHALICDPNRAARTASDTFTVFWRELYRALTFGQCFWWMDINGLRDDWYGDEDMVEMFRQQSLLYQKWTRIPRRSVAQILFVEDEASCGHMTYISGLSRSLRMRLERELRLCGAPVDHLRLQDLFEVDLSAYKVIVFNHAFVMPAETWKKLECRIRPDATVLWNYAAGLLGPKTDPANQKRVTGFNTVETPERMSHPNLYRHFYWHGPNPCPRDYPLLSIVPEAGQTVLETSGDGQILTAQVSRGQGRSVLAAEFTLRAPLLRRLLEEAGVDFAAPVNCAVLADSGLIGFFPHRDVCFEYVFDGLWRNVLTGETVTGPQHLSVREKKLLLFEKADLPAGNELK